MVKQFKGVAAAVTLVLAGALAGAAPASAAYTCEASALRGTLLGTQTIEPVTANKGAAECRAQRGGGASVLAPLAALPVPLGASAVFAETGLEGSATNVPAQTATASGGIGDVRIGLPTALVSQLPTQQAIEALQPITVPLTGAPSLPLPGGITLPASVTVDLRPALRKAFAPNADLLRLQVGVAYAKASCAGGAVSLEGSSRVLGLTALGNELPVDRAVSQALQVVGGGAVRPGELDVTQLGIEGITDPALLAAVQGVLNTALDSLPAITLPASLVDLRVTPSSQEKTATTLTQRGPQVSLALGGRPIVDLVVGEAKVGATGVDCAPANVAQAALDCTTRRIVLIDVLPGSRRVQLYGAADRRFVGRTVNIVFTHNNRVVSRARVRQDGTFRATAAMPSRRLRGTNRARYQARIGNERSLRLKLQRRMIVRSVRRSGDTVRITGRVSRPLAAPARTIEVRRRVSCRRWVVVKRIRPNRDGSFSTSVAAPPANQAATYRFATRVRKTTRNPKTFPTFTLPRYVDNA